MIPSKEEFAAAALSGRALNGPHTQLITLRSPLRPRHNSGGFKRMEPLSCDCNAERARWCHQHLQQPMVCRTRQAPRDLLVLDSIR
eukprot:275653-Amphidinium_carterae.2